MDELPNHDRVQHSDQSNPQKINKKSIYPFSLSEQFRKLGLPDYKTIYCKHKHGCIESLLLSTTKNLIAGMLIKIGMNMLFGLKKIITNPKNLLEILFNRDILKFGGFLGTLVLLFRGMVCLLRRITPQQKQKYIPLISGFISGLFAILFLQKKQRQSYALFLLARSIDITYTSLVKKGILPHFKYFYVLMYCATIGVTGWVYSTDPSAIPPDIHRFYLLFNNQGLQDLQMRQIWIQRQNNYLKSKGISPINTLDYLPKLKAYLQHYKMI